MKHIIISLSLLLSLLLATVAFAVTSTVDEDGIHHIEATFEEALTDCVMVGRIDNPEISDLDLTLCCLIIMQLETE